MRFPSAESSEFPNDNPKLHQGASWICLDPLGAPRPVARPEVIAKAGNWPEPVAAAATPRKVQSTLLPPPSPETEQLVARFIARITAPRSEDPAASAKPMDAGLRMKPIAQFMLDELPNYRVRRTAANVPAPPAHVYSTLPAVADSAAPPSPASQPSLADVVAALATELSVPAPASDGETSEMASGNASEIRELVRSIRLEFSEPDMDTPLSLVDSLFAPPNGATQLSLPPIAEHTLRPEAFIAWASAKPEVTRLDTLVPEARDTIVQQAQAVTAVVHDTVILPPPHANGPEIEAEPAIAAAPVSTAESAIDAYAAFIAALSDVLLQRGATRGAAMIQPLLESARVEGAALGETLVQQLEAAGLGSTRGDQFLLNETWTQTAAGWRSLLREETHDFSSCAETLDDWATRLAQALLPSGATATEIRRELRRRGVAAFGMLAAAA